MGVRVFVGNVAHDATEGDLQDEFNKFNPARIWIARKPPGFAFIEFDDSRDADDAVRKLDGVNGWKVELSRNAGPRERREGGGDGRCYQCGEPGHFARECPNGGGGGGRRDDRYDRRDDRYDRRDDRHDRRDNRRDDRYDRRDDRYERRRSRSPPPRRRSPSGSPRRRASPSPSPARRYSRSPSR